MTIGAGSLSFLLVGVGVFGSVLKASAQAGPVIRGGEMVHYDLAEPVGAETVVTQFSIALEPQRGSDEPSWFRLSATKRNGKRFTVWRLGQGDPEADVDAARAGTKRYLLQRGDEPPVEYRDRLNGNAVLPVLGGWKFLFPGTGREIINCIPGFREGKWNFPMGREGKIEADIPGKLEFPLTPAAS